MWNLPNCVFASWVSCIGAKSSANVWYIVSMYRVLSSSDPVVCIVGTKYLGMLFENRVTKYSELRLFFLFANRLNEKSQDIALVFGIYADGNFIEVDYCCSSHVFSIIPNSFFIALIFLSIFFSSTFLERFDLLGPSQSLRVLHWTSARFTHPSMACGLRQIQEFSWNWFGESSLATILHV